MKRIKVLFCKKKKAAPEIRYVHPTQNVELKESIDGIINQLNAAILIAKKMQIDNCEVEIFKMYKKMFHETWLGVAKYYNVVNCFDLENCSNIRHMS